MLWYIMDVYTSYIIGITKKHNFYLITHTGTLEIQFFKEIGGNMVRIVFRKNYFKSQLLLESAATTIRDTIMIFSTVYHIMVCLTPTQFQHPTQALGHQFTKCHNGPLKRPTVQRCLDLDLNVIQIQRKCVSLKLKKTQFIICKNND